MCVFSHVQPFVIPWTSQPGSSVHGILQARILEWVANSYSRGKTHISCILSLAGGFFTTGTTWEALKKL